MLFQQLLRDGVHRTPDKIALHWVERNRSLTYAQAVELFRKNLDFLNSADLAQILGKTVQEVWPFGL